MSQVSGLIKEGNIISSILKYLKCRKVKAWRNNTGARLMGGGWVRFGMKGSPDIIGILPGGKFLGIEVKMDSGKLSLDQERFIDDINSMGGVGFVARNVKDVCRGIE